MYIKSISTYTAYNVLTYLASRADLNRRDLCWFILARGA